MRTLLIVCALLSAGLLSGPVDARVRDRGADAYQVDDDDGYEVDRDDRRVRRDYRERQAEAARKALMRNGGGRVLSVESLGGSGYRVKVLKDGEVRVHLIEVN